MAAGNLANLCQIKQQNQADLKKADFDIHQNLYAENGEFALFSRIHGTSVSTYRIIAYNENSHQFFQVEIVKKKSNHNVIKLDAGSESRDKNK